MAKNKLLDVQKIRDSAMGRFSARIAAFLLIFSFIDATLLCFYIIGCYKMKEFHLRGWGLVIVLFDMWFLNNVMLKTSIYLFGGTNDDRRVINIAGNFLNSIKSKRDEKKTKDI